MGDKRIDFFNFLETGDSDWQAEQAYHVNKARRIWTKGHGSGILEGLKVVQTSPASLDVTVQAGFAVDDSGNEILLEQDQTVALSGFVPGSGNQTVYIVARVDATEVDPVYVDELDASRNSHIEDVVTIEAQDTAPGAGEIELARVNLGAGALTVQDAADPDNPGENEIDLRSVALAPVASRRRTMTLFSDETDLQASAQTQVISSQVHWDPAEWPKHPRAILEVVGAVTAGGDTGRVSLWNESAGAELFGVDLTSTTVGVERSQSSINLPAFPATLAIRIETTVGTGNTILYAARLHVV